MIKKILFVSMVLFLNFFVKAQENPINSNYLIDHGISPRIIDAAASSFMQDGHFTDNVRISIDKNGKKKVYELLLIYDPSYNEGMDIRTVSKAGSLSKKELKEIKHFIEKSHYLSRLSRNYLYDESSLKIIRTVKDTVVLGFHFQKNDIDPYLQYIKRIKGEIYVVNGILKKVILTNTRPLKKHITEFQKEVHYSKVKEGGYIVSEVTEKILTEKKGKRTEAEIYQKTISYTDEDGNLISWDGQKVTEPSNFDKEDVIDVKLGGTLPFLGKEATKLGYKLPLPYGAAAFIYAHDQLMEFTGLQVSFDDGEMVDLQDLFMLNDSKVSQSTFMTLVKGDIWIFPFLNVMVIVGGGKNKLDGELVINEDLRDFFNGLPDWIDLPNIPYSIPINSTITSEIYGGGLTLAGGIGDFNLSVNYQLMFTKIVEANTTNMVNVITPMFGYMSAFGINFMAGAQGQFYNTKISGFIELEDKDSTLHKINYNVDFKPIKWNAIVGVYKNFNKHWEMSFQAGFGQRSSLTAIIGYRL